MSSQRGSASRLSYTLATPVLPARPVQDVRDVYGGPLDVNVKCPGAPRWECMPLPDVEVNGFITPPGSPQYVAAPLPVQSQAAPVPYRRASLASPARDQALGQASLFPDEEGYGYNDSPFVPTYLPTVAPGGPTPNQLYLSRHHGQQSSWMPRPGSQSRIHTPGLGMDMTDARNAQFTWGQQSTRQWGYEPAQPQSSVQRGVSRRRDDEEEDEDNGASVGRKSTARHRLRGRER